jgi:hypothetical protein
MPGDLKGGTDERKEIILLAHQALDCWFEFSCAILGVEAFANDEVEFGLASCAGLFEGEVCVCDGFVDVESVQVDLMRPAVLATASGQ